MAKFQHTIDNSFYWQGRGRHTSILKIYNKDFSPKSGQTYPFFQRSDGDELQIGDVVDSSALAIQIRPNPQTGVIHMPAGKAYYMDLEFTTTGLVNSLTGINLTSHSALIPQTTNIRVRKTSVHSVTKETGEFWSINEFNHGGASFPDLKRDGDKLRFRVVVMGDPYKSLLVFDSGVDYRTMVGYGFRSVGVGDSTGRNSIKVLDIGEVPIVRSQIGDAEYTYHLGGEFKNGHIEVPIYKESYLAPYYGYEKFSYLEGNEELYNFELYGANPEDQERDCLEVGIPTPKIDSRASVLHADGTETPSNYKNTKYNIFNTISNGDLSAVLEQDGAEVEEGSKLKFKVIKGGQLEDNAKNRDAGIGFQIDLEGEPISVEEGYVTSGPYADAPAEGQYQDIYRAAYCKNTDKILTAILRSTEAGGESSNYYYLDQYGWPVPTWLNVTDETYYHLRNEDNNKINILQKEGTGVVALLPDELSTNGSGIVRDLERRRKNNVRNLVLPKFEEDYGKGRAGTYKTPNYRLHVHNSKTYEVYTNDSESVTLKVSNLEFDYSDPEKSWVEKYFTFDNVNTLLSPFNNISSFRLSKSSARSPFVRAFNTFDASKISLGLESFDIEIVSDNEVRLVFSVFYRGETKDGEIYRQISTLPLCYSVSYLLDMGDVPRVINLGSSEVSKVYPYRDLEIGEAQFTNIKIKKGESSSLLTVLDVFRDYWNSDDASQVQGKIEEILPRGNAIIMAASGGIWKRIYMVFHNEHDYAPLTEANFSLAKSTKINSSIINKDFKDDDEILSVYQTGVKIDDCVAIERADGFIDVIYSRTGNVYNHQLSPYVVNDPPMWVNPSANYLRVTGESVAPFSTRLAEETGSGEDSGTISSFIYEPSLYMLKDAHGGVKKQVLYAKGFHKDYTTPMMDTPTEFGPVYDYGSLGENTLVSRGRSNTKIQDLEVNRMRGGMNLLSFSIYSIYKDRESPIWRGYSSLVSDRTSRIERDNDSTVRVDRLDINRNIQDLADSNSITAYPGDPFALFPPYEVWTSKKSNIYNVTNTETGEFYVDINLSASAETGGPFGSLNGIIHVNAEVRLDQIPIGETAMVAGVTIDRNGFVNGAPTYNQEGDQEGRLLILDITDDEVYALRVVSDSTGEHLEAILSHEPLNKRKLDITPRGVLTDQSILPDTVVGNRSNREAIFLGSTSSQVTMARVRLNRPEAFRGVSVGIRSKPLSQRVKGTTVYSDKQKVYLGKDLTVTFGGEGAKTGHEIVFQGESIHHSNFATDLTSYGRWMSKGDTELTETDIVTLHRNVMYKDEIDFQWSMLKSQGLAITGTNILEGIIGGSLKSFTTMEAQLHPIPRTPVDSRTVDFLTEYYDITGKVLLFVGRGHCLTYKAVSINIGDVVTVELDRDLFIDPSWGEWFVCSDSVNIPLSEDDMEKINAKGGDLRIYMPMNSPIVTAYTWARRVNTTNYIRQAHQAEISKIALYETSNMTCNYAGGEIAYSSQSIKGDSISGHADVDLLSYTKEYTVNLAIDSPDNFKSFLDLFDYARQIASSPKVVVISEGKPSLASISSGLEASTVQAFLEEGIGKTATIELQGPA